MSDSVSGLNIDFSRRVVLDTNALDWAPSPQPGVERRMLEREEAESGRATSIVRYAPGAGFPRHNHGGGEEIYVLEGEFADDTGSYPAGSYLRNPIGSAHQPHCPQGCVIFVKLCHLAPEETEAVRVDTSNGEWQGEGLQRMLLYQNGGERVLLARYAPGARLDGDFHDGGEEVLVLDGLLEDEHGRYPAGTWLRQPHGSSHSPFSEKGCTLFVKRGHLPR